jgi:hypothetical protein
MPDDMFAEPRLVQVYDAAEGERDDLDHLSLSRASCLVLPETLRRIRFPSGL